MFTFAPLQIMTGILLGILAGHYVGLVSLAATIMASPIVVTIARSFEKYRTQSIQELSITYAMKCMPLIQRVAEAVHMLLHEHMENGGEDFQRQLLPYRTQHDHEVELNPLNLLHATKEVIRKLREKSRNIRALQGHISLEEAKHTLDQNLKKAESIMELLDNILAFRTLIQMKDTRLTGRAMHEAHRLFERMESLLRQVHN